MRCFELMRAKPEEKKSARFSFSFPFPRRLSFQATRLTFAACPSRIPCAMLSSTALGSLCTTLMTNARVPGSAEAEPAPSAAAASDRDATHISNAIAIAPAIAFRSMNIVGINASTPHRAKVERGISAASRKMQPGRISKGPLHDFRTGTGFAIAKSIDQRQAARVAAAIAPMCSGLTKPHTSLGWRPLTRSRR